MGWLDMVLSTPEAPSSIPSSARVGGAITVRSCSLSRHCAFRLKPLNLYLEERTPTLNRRRLRLARYWGCDELYVCNPLANEGCRVLAALAMVRVEASASRLALATRAATRLSKFIGDQRLG